MKIGLHLSDFTFSNGPGRLADDLTRVVVAAEDAGFARVSVMDHVWQISVHGPPEHEMLEAYTTLGYIAARTSRVDLLAWVTAVTYREPGLLAKIVSTLDVLSGGRAWLGIGAGWNEDEASGLGLSFPPLAERFDRLEEALQICRQMWGPDDGPYRRAALPTRSHAERAAAAAPAADPDRGRWGAQDVAAGRAVRRRVQPVRRAGAAAQAGRAARALRRPWAGPTTRSRRPARWCWTSATAARRSTTSSPPWPRSGSWASRPCRARCRGVWEPERIALFKREVIPAAADL